MRANDIANTLNASINDVCKQNLRYAIEKYGEAPVMNEVRAVEDAFRELGSGKLPIYHGLGPIVYAIWYQQCHTAMAYRIFRALIQNRSASSGASGIGEEIHVVDVGSGAHAGLFGLTLAVANSIETNGHAPFFRFDSLEPSEDMAIFGCQLWDDFLKKSSRPPIYSHVERALKHIRVNDTKRSVKALDLQHDSRSASVESWVSAFHVVYDDTLDELRTTIRELDAAIEPEIGVLTGYRSKLRTLYPFTQLKFTDLMSDGSFTTSVDYLNHCYKTRKRSENTKKGMDDQIHSRGYWHGPNSECPKDAVIKIFKRVTGQRRDTRLQVTLPKSKPSYPTNRRRVLPTRCKVDNQKLAIVHPPRGQIYHECQACGTKYR